MTFRNPFVVFAVSLLLAASLLNQIADAATANKAMVVTADDRATKAALEVLRAGGNAADAAIAAQWVLNVVEPGSSGIGGGGFFVYYDAAADQTVTLDGREKAPMSAAPGMFLREDGTPVPFYPDRITGGLPVGVPGALKLLEEVHRRFGSGKYSFAALFQPAIDLAENGFTVTPRLAGFLDDEKDRLGRFDGSRRLFLKADGTPYREGETLIMTGLGKTFRLIQKEGTGVFYGGQIGKAIVDTVQTAVFNRGSMTLEDLAAYEVVERAAVSADYRGFKIVSMGPPSSGATTLLEALKILELFDVRPREINAEDAALFSAVQRIAFEDRNKWLGDPDFTEIPAARLISEAHAWERVRAIRDGRFLKKLFEDVNDVLSALEEQAKMEKLTRPSGIAAEDSPNTSHISIVDEQGNAASFTTTIEAVFGSGMVVEGWGFVLNNELTDFDPIPADGEGRAVPNAPGPGKRPRSSMTPAIVFKDGKPLIIVGSPGGSAIIGTVFNMIVYLLDYQMPLDKAIAAPRFIHRGDALEYESSANLSPEFLSELSTYGEALRSRRLTGNVQAIYIDSTTRLIYGAGDPRGEGFAEGY